MPNTLDSFSVRGEGLEELSWDGGRLQFTDELGKTSVISKLPTKLSLTLKYRLCKLPGAEIVLTPTTMATVTDVLSWGVESISGGRLNGKIVGDIQLLLTCFSQLSVYPSTWSTQKEPLLVYLPETSFTLFCTYLNLRQYSNNRVDWQIGGSSNVSGLPLMDNRISMFVSPSELKGLRVSVPYYVHPQYVLCRPEVGDFFIREFLQGARP